MRTIEILGALILGASAAKAAILIDVNVAGLGAGPAQVALTNHGSVAGSFILFNPAGQPTPGIGVVGGIAGIHLNHEQHCQNVHQRPLTPAALTAAGASRTIEVWGRIPAQEHAEEMIMKAVCIGDARNPLTSGSASPRCGRETP